MLQRFVSNKINGLLALLKFDNWPALLIDRLFFRTPALIYCLRGRPILIDHAGGDCGGTRDVLASGMYDGYLAAIGHGVIRNVIDIGANGGGFALCLMLREDPVERLVCIEMNTNTHTRLQYNVSRNRIGSERHCLNAALSDVAGYIEVRLGEGSAGDSLSNALISKNGDSFRIETVTLTQILNRYFSDRNVDLCKIDIEGGEHGVLQNAAASTFSRVRYLLIELHPTPASSVSDGVARIRALGFKEIQVTRKHGDVFLFENLHFVAG